MPSQDSKSSPPSVLSSSESINYKEPQPRDAKVECVSQGPSGSTVQAAPPLPPLSLAYYLQGVPSPLILAAFKLDCQNRGLQWERQPGQRFALELFLRHPLAVRCPPRKRSLQSFLKLYIAALEQEVAVLHTTEGSDMDGDPIIPELLTAHVDMFLIADTPESSMCFQSFFSLLEGPPPSAQPPGEEGAAPSLSVHWNSAMVACDLFRNVGLSLWPAAFALTELLSQELRGFSSIIPTLVDLQSPRRVRVVELGAGVGLTPCVLDAQPAFRSKVESFCATDYQVELTENIRQNFWLNGLYEAETLSSVDQRRTEEEDVKQQDTSLKTSHRIKVLDWNEREMCESIFSLFGSDLLLAADCIYDVSVIAALVSTIEDGLRVKIADDELNEGLCRQHGQTYLPPPKRSAVVVQTHRQDSTMKVFYDEVRQRGLTLKSYRLLQLPIDVASRMVAEHPEKYTPVGDWKLSVTLASALPSGQVVPVLQCDELLEDGSFNSVKQEAKEKKKRKGDQLLEAGFIGSYYVSMMGLLGIHIVTLE